MAKALATASSRARAAVIAAWWMARVARSSHAPEAAQAARAAGDVAREELDVLAQVRGAVARADPEWWGD